jgi:hypothetical protein
MPGNRGGVIAGTRLDPIGIDFAEIDDADRSAARIAVRIAERAQLLQPTRADAGFFE